MNAPKVDVLTALHRAQQHAGLGATGAALRDIDNAAAAAAELIAQRDALKQSLEAMMTMDVRGHQLQNRLQFSDAGRAILQPALAALARARSAS